MSEESSNSAETKSINKDLIEAVNLLAHGKRNILCGEISQAVTQLQEACRILGVEYGELADECADAYHWYGKALLELYRIESGVLGDAIPGAESEESDNSEDESDDDDDDQNSTKEDNGAEEEELEDGVMSEDLEEEETGEGAADKDEEEVNKIITPSHEANTNINSNDIQEVDSETGTVIASIPNAVVTGNDTNSAESKQQGPTTPPAETADSTQVAGSSKSKDSDDISNLQLAWEMLELSKIIYQRHSQAEMRLKLAETYLRLGEIGMETEQYDQAINDLTQCLEIQQQILEPEDRRLAETLYQLGLACTYCLKYESAVEHYLSAMTVIRAKIDHLARIVTGEIPPDPVENGDGFYTPLELAQKEIEELQKVLPDISAKIDDVRDEQSEADKVKIMMKETVAPPSGSQDGMSESAFKASPSTSAQQVNNISHLVRKKRKSEDELKQLPDAIKRPKTASVPPESISQQPPSVTEAERASALALGDADSASLLKIQESQTLKKLDV